MFSGNLNFVEKHFGSSKNKYTFEFIYEFPFLYNLYLLYLVEGLTAQLVATKNLRGLISGATGYIEQNNFKVEDAFT